MAGVRDIQRRQVQLDVLSNVLVIALLIIVGLLIFLLVSFDDQFALGGPLADYIPRVLLAGFTLAVLLYLTDQRRRLREKIAETTEELEQAHAESAATCARLALAHETACTLGEVGVDEGLRVVLSRGAETLGADALAVVTQEVDHAYYSPDVSTEIAEGAVLRAAMKAVGHDAAFYVDSGDDSPGQAIAVPLRAREELHSILCAWRQNEPFAQDQLDCLAVLGRMIELAMEREKLLTDAEDQLEGTLEILQQVATGEHDGFPRHAMLVADLATAIGQRMGVTGEHLQNLRMAGLIHDVGMISDTPSCDESGYSPELEETIRLHEHSRVGAQLARDAGLPREVQAAVLTHHERVDGSGEPEGLKQGAIPLGGRVLAVAEAAGSMTQGVDRSQPIPWPETVNRLKAGAGSAYDPAVVKALLGVIESHELDFIGTPTAVAG